MTKEQILVLGGGGFIGRRIVSALAASSWAAPIAASRSQAPTGSTSVIRRLRLDATDPAQLEQALGGVTAVINCVAGGPKTIVDGARALFAAAARAGRETRIVHLSSMAVYGDAVGVVGETQQPTGSLSGYGAAKLESERLATDCAAVTILRPGIVYGPDSQQWSARIAELLRSHRLGDLGAAGDGYCNLVYVDDVVEATLRALRPPQTGHIVANLAMPNPPTWNEYFIAYARALGAVPVRRITRRRLAIESKLVAPPLKVMQLGLNRVLPGLASRVPEPIPPSLVRLFAQEIQLHPGRAEQLLGLQWTRLDEGLARAAAWYLATTRGSSR